MKIWSLATVFAASGAHAMEPKQCMSLADMNAALRADGQRTLIIGDREAIQDPTGHARDMTVDRYANAVTANEDGSLGYQIEGDLPRDRISTKMCVRAKLTNVHLFDAHQSASPPQEVMLGGSFNQGVYELKAKGTRAMLVGDTFRGNDPTVHGNPLVVFGNMASRSGSLITNGSKGPELLAVMGNVDYTPEALRRLAEPSGVK